MAETGRAASRLTALDGLRGLCASMIVVYHMTPEGPLIGSVFVRNAYLFVDFFFALSGFVISHSFAERLSSGRLPLRRFLWSRIAAIGPLYWIMLAIFVAMNVAGATLGAREGGRSAFAYPDDPLHILISVVMLQTFFGGSALILNVPGWSVAVEMLIYLICGSLMRFAGRGLPIAMAIVLVAGLGALIASGGTIAQFGPLALARCAYGFAIGHFLWRASRRIDTEWRGFAAMEGLAVAGVILFVWLAGSSRWSLAAPLVFGVAILILSFARGPVSALLSARIPVAIGGASYALYISHFLFDRRLLPHLLAHVPTLARSPLGSDLVLLGCLPLLILCSLLLTRFVQQPARRLLEAAAAGVSRPASRQAPERLAPGTT